MSRLTVALLLAVGALGVSPAHADVVGKVVVHTHPRDVDGDGGSWAWGQGRGATHSVIRAGAPSRAAKVLGVLEDGDQFLVGGNGLSRGLYTVDPTGNVVVVVDQGSSVETFNAALTIPMRKV